MGKQFVNDTDGRQTYYVSETAKVGKNCDIRHGVIIEDDVIVGNNCFIGEYAHITEGTVIDDYVYIGARVMILNLDRIVYMRDIATKLRPAHIKYGSRIAPAATILPGVTIGENALVGIAAVVIKDVPARQIWFGFPAKKRGNIPDDECINANLAKSKSKK
jgi:UDP-2-acetamido-3-amino-2,3-dideoxy-glucuronate N-acetyltransferase